MSSVDSAHKRIMTRKHDRAQKKKIAIVDSIFNGNIIVFLRSYSLWFWVLGTLISPVDPQLAQVTKF
jgi:hypothetical protein